MNLIHLFVSLENSEDKILSLECIRTIYILISKYDNSDLESLSDKYPYFWNQIKYLIFYKYWNVFWYRFNLTELIIFLLIKNKKYDQYSKYLSCLPDIHLKMYIENRFSMYYHHIKNIYNQQLNEDGYISDITNDDDY